MSAESTWITIERPGYLGNQKEKKYDKWDKDFGRENWRLAWQLRNNLCLDYSAIFFQVYVTGYRDYFLKNPKEAGWVSKHSS